MTDAPKRIWAGGDELRFETYWRSIPHPQPELSRENEYHLARPSQPCSTDEFLERLIARKFGLWRQTTHVVLWVNGNFEDAMEGLE